jgi:peptidoglycan-associated lipoprotein
MSKAVVLFFAVVVMMSACARTPDSRGTSVPTPGGGTAGAPGVGTAGSGSTGAGAGSAAAEAARLAGTAPVAPSVQRAAPKEFVSMSDLKDVFFDFDQYAIRPADEPALLANAKWLKANENYLVLIEGHADERGTNEYNVALGERRAKATMNFLVAQGVQARRMNIISYGEERPSCRLHNEACWTKNRRAHFLVKQQ